MSYPKHIGKPPGGYKPPKSKRVPCKNCNQTLDLTLAQCGHCDMPTPEPRRVTTIRGDEVTTVELDEPGVSRSLRLRGLLARATKTVPWIERLKSATAEAQGLVFEDVLDLLGDIEESSEGLLAVCEFFEQQLRGEKKRTLSLIGGKREMSAASDLEKKRLQEVWRVESEILKWESDTRFWEETEKNRLQKLQLKDYEKRLVTESRIHGEQLADADGVIRDQRLEIRRLQALMRPAQEAQEADLGFLDGLFDE